MLCTQYGYIYCHVKRVKRLHYAPNVDTFNTMSKGSKDYVMYTIEIHSYHQILCMSKNVKGVKSQNIFRPLRYT